MAMPDAPKQTDINPVVPDKTPVQARQGLISGRVITVLIVSLTLAIVAMILAWLAFR